MTDKLVFFKLVFPKVTPNFPTNPEAEIHARHDGTFEQLTPKLTESDFEKHIDLLISELEQIRREGKRKFTSTKKQVIGIRQTK